MQLKLAFEMVLRLYPEGHRTILRQEMLAVLGEAAQEHRKRGRTAYLFFVLRELVGLVIGGSAEQFSNLINARRYEGLEHSGLEQGTEPGELMETQRRIEFALRRMEYAIAHHQFEKARFYSAAEYRLREQLRMLQDENS